MGVPSSVITTEMVDAHGAAMSTIGLQKSIGSRDQIIMPNSSFTEGDRVLVFFKTSTENERVRWIELRGVSAKQHGFKGGQTNCGPPMTVENEHIRIVPNLAEELLNRTLKDEQFIESNDNNNY